MRNTKGGLPPNKTDNTPIIINRPEKKYSQEELDMIDDKFKIKDTYLTKITQPIDNVSTQYKKTLNSIISIPQALVSPTGIDRVVVPQPILNTSSDPIVKESIIFDPTLNKWKIIKK